MATGFSTLAVSGSTFDDNVADTGGGLCRRRGDAADAHEHGDHEQQRGHVSAAPTSSATRVSGDRRRSVRQHRARVVAAVYYITSNNAAAIDGAAARRNIGGSRAGGGMYVVAGTGA